MGWTTFLLSYLLGGVTFLPLVAASILLHAYLTFPYREDVAPSQKGPGDDGDDLVQAGDDLRPLKAAQKLLKDEQSSRAQHHHHEPDVAAGYFAVCREYTPMGINAKPIERSTPVGSTTVAAPSPSVYQTMYRSIFDRKQTPGPLDNNKNPNQRPKKAGNVFYVALRHGHLMLFDDDEQLEVRHVISLSHHDVSIYSGGDVTPEGELFIKRNALCLSRKTDSLEVGPDTQVTKPFYLFSENCSAKEDFYFALLRNQEQNAAPEHGKLLYPIPAQFDVKNIISLVQRLHSSEEHLQTRWLNGMIGRIFLGIHDTKDLESFIRAKITKKISRVKRPSFLSGILIRKIDTGDSAPYFTNPRLKDLTVEGECGVEADVRYTGNFRIEVAAKARIDLGSRFKVREVDLVLAVMIRKVEGHVLLKIKPPPSNRIWFSFQQMPKIEMAIEPVVSSRQITYTVILRQIEHRIKEVIAESVVLPFWDDVPFFRTEHKKWRGGIFAGDDYVEPSPELAEAEAQIGAVDTTEKLEDGESGELPPMEKSHSVPVIENTVPTGLFGRKLKDRGLGSPKASASSTSIETKNDGGSSSAQRHARSGSIANAPASSVGADATNADFSRPSSSPPEHHASTASAMAILSARSQGNTPAHTPLGSPSRPTAFSKASSHASGSSREATDSEKDNDQSSASQASKARTSSLDEGANQDASSVSSLPVSIKGPGIIKSQTGSITRGLFRRENTNASTSSRSTTNTVGSGGVPAPQDPHQKRTALAAVSNAAGVAKRWGLSALQRHNEGGGGNGSSNSNGANNSNNSKGGGSGSGEADSHSHIDLSQPMGRGQPLPPPGVPLPGPDKKSKAAAIPTPKRKPLLPPPAPALPERKSVAAGSEAAAATGEHNKTAERRPVPPPPLPRRRKISQPEPEDDDDGRENMLVVAAPPADSEPASPAAVEEERHSYMQPWVEDEGVEGVEGVEGGGHHHDHHHYDAPREPEEDVQLETPPALPARDDSPPHEVVDEKDRHLQQPSRHMHLHGQRGAAGRDRHRDDEEGDEESTPLEKDERQLLEEEAPAPERDHGHAQPIHDEEKAAMQEPEELQARPPNSHVGRGQVENDDDDEYSAWMDDGEHEVPTSHVEALVTSEGMAQ